MNTIFEELGGTYVQCGNYLIPDLRSLEGTKQHIGKYGRMRMEYLKEQQRSLYNQLILSGKLTAHLAEIDQTCRERLERMISEIK